jgi:anti-sigma regulatory factor (Ser/Thr protein kinase)
MMSGPASRADGFTGAFPPIPESACLARAASRSALAGRPEAVIEVAQLLVSELVTNAVLHARSAPTLFIQADQDEIRVVVHDESSAPPQLQPSADQAAAGRGLSLVSGLATSWGWSQTPTGKNVWFTL